MTSCRAIGRKPKAERRFSPILPFTFSAFSIRPSTEPNSVIHLAAVFSPHFGTPGTLSILSPIRARKSMIFSGGTPNFFSTPSLFSQLLSLPIVFTRRTLSLTSWAKSLSPVAITTLKPSSTAFFVRVPMVSSASIPGTWRKGIPSFWTPSKIRGICTERSSGIGGRLAL